MGVARMPTQGSWRPVVCTVVGSPLRSIERRGRRMLEVGLSAMLTRMSWPAELREMPAHLDAIPLAQPFLGDRSRGDADHGLASGGPAAAAIVAQAVFLPVRVVGVTGAEGVGERAVVPAPLVFVSDDKTDRRARGPALENAREDLDAVGLLALRDVAGAAGLAPVELSLDVAFRELEPGRTAVHDAAVRGPVALAKRSHAIQQAEGVAGHGKSRKERAARLA